MRAYYRHDGQQFGLVILVGIRRKRIEIIEPAAGVVRAIPLEELASMRQVRASMRQVRKMRRSLKRLARRPGTSKKYRDAVRRVLEQSPNGGQDNGTESPEPIEAAPVAGT